MASSATHLVILPGLTSAFHPKYRERYDALCSAARDSGIEARIVVYPGQPDADGSIVGELSPDGAVEAVLRAVRELHGE
ncbi:MAG: hypothetical protein ACOYOB_19665, partial [Myxococcota bacterium]